MPLDRGYLNPHPALTPRAVFTMAGPREVIPLVYVLWLKGVPVYVGSSQCVRERIYEHIAFRRIGADSLSYVCFATAKEAFDAEQMTIRLLNPRHNRIAHGETPFFGCIKKPAA